jgi:hypothetical protein
MARMDVFPPALECLPTGATLGATLAARAGVHPELLWGLLLFAAAILHTFLAPSFARLGHALSYRHPLKGRLIALLGETEFVFILWSIPLFLMLGAMKGFSTAIEYLGRTVNYREPLFVVVVMALAATKPVMLLSERVIGAVARLLGGTVGAWWMALLAIGPLLGSLITEPAAITITAMLLAKKFFAHAPSLPLAYATIALLFVNVSVGGMLTHFAAPPVVMVAAKWGLDTPFMFTHFGWRVILGICANVALVRFLFRREFAKLAQVGPLGEHFERVPRWITLVHVALLVWVVLLSEEVPLFIFALLVGFWFVNFTREHQDGIAFEGALRVGVFLAGLVIFGGLQQWWLAPVLSGLSSGALFWGATILTSFNDNAAITYLVSQVPNLTDALKYAVLAGAVTGGGLTVIANAPNPAGQTLLRKFFPRRTVNPLWLALAALLPTLVLAVAFMVLPH